MRFSEDMHFPHPVLAESTGDYLKGSFSVDLRVDEELKTNSVDLNYRVSLDQPDILELIEAGKADAGLFMRCEDTYFTGIRRLELLSATLSFRPDQLLNRVSIWPLVWLASDLKGWTPSGVHPEFGAAVDLAKGDILALGNEQVIFAGKAKLAPLESIFKLTRSDDAKESEVDIKLDPDKIKIVVDAKTHALVTSLREDKDGKPALLNGLYLPVVMCVLDNLRANPSAFDSCRWYQPFAGKCSLLGINTENPQLLTDAQHLLGFPIQKLAALTVD